VAQGSDVEEEGENKGGGLQPVEIVRFVLGCARKHWIVGVSLFLAISVPGAFFARMLPLEYGTRARILVVSKEGIRARVTGGEAERLSEEMAGVADRLLRVESLRAIVDAMGLEKTWLERRPQLLVWKDRLRGSALDLPKEERVRAWIGAVASKLSVNADGWAGVLTIEGRWSDAQTAYDLVESVKNQFLQDRLRNEVQVFEEVIAILEQQKKDAGQEVERGLVRVEQAGWRSVPTQASGVAGAGVSGAASPGVGESASPGRGSRLVDTVVETGTPDAASVAKLASVRLKIREVQEPWQRRLTELKLQLSDLNAHYGPKHPLVVNQESRIQEASAAPPGLDSLRAEEAELSSAVEDASRPKERIVIRNLGKGNGDDTASSSSPSESSRVKVESSATLSTEQSKLVQAVNKYNGLVDRIDKTRAELNIAATAFKYRFSVVEAPEVPSGPLKPKLPLFIAVGSVVFGALAGLLFGAIRELLSGKLSAPWQAKTLGIPLLGELYLEDERG
jgi:uncharacterized protein involved in exopolysaccharide biosynthesis